MLGSCSMLQTCLLPSRQQQPATRHTHSNALLTKKEFSYNSHRQKDDITAKCSIQAACNLATENCCNTAKTILLYATTGHQDIAPSEPKRDSKPMPPTSLHPVYRALVSGRTVHCDKGTPRPGHLPPHHATSLPLHTTTGVMDSMASTLQTQHCVTRQLHTDQCLKNIKNES